MLVAAFALSILIHAIVAFVAHPLKPTHASEIGTKLIQVQRIVAIRPTQPPRTPPPHAKRRAIAVPHLAQARPRSHAPVPAPPAAPPATPAAVARVRPTPASGCTDRNAPAALVATPAPPQIPPAVRAQGVSGIAAVRVQLDTDGSVRAAALEQSTSSPSFDALAIAMARDARYAPARRDCIAVASSYLFRVQFSAW